jgi:hypothetical protein
VEERRSQDPTPPRVDGRRDTDPRLTAGDCARLLRGAVSRQFILREIKAGRLRALKIPRPMRDVYRVSPADLRVYKQKYCLSSRKSA